LEGIIEAAARPPMHREVSLINFLRLTCLVMKDQLIWL